MALGGRRDTLPNLHARPYVADSEISGVHWRVLIVCALQLRCASQPNRRLALRQNGMDIARCYEVLEISSGADAEAVRVAYHDLIRVWHPDRHGKDERLRRKADEKTRAVNAAYATLQVHLGHQNVASSARPTTVRTHHERPARSGHAARSPITLDTRRSPFQGWRSGSQVVLPLGLDTSSRCAVCYQVSSVCISQSVRYVPPSANVGLLFGPFALSVQEMLTKRCDVRLGLCAKHSQQQIRRRRVGLLLLGLSIGTAAIGLAFEADFLFAVALVAALPALLVARRLAKPSRLTAKYMDDNYVWLNGFGTDYVNACEPIHSSR